MGKGGQRKLPRLFIIVEFSFYDVIIIEKITQKQLISFEMRRMVNKKKLT